jgi:hypothetical protein
MTQRRLVWLTIAVFLLPIVVDLAVTGVRWPFGWLASDSFYYLTVARNINRGVNISFDGERLTNGFHPLWQALSAGVYGISSWLPETAILTVTVLAGAALIALAIWLLGRALDGQLPSLFVLLPVGFYALLVSPLWIFGEHFGMHPTDIDEGWPPLYGTLWSYANGMESSVVIVSFALAAMLFARRDLDAQAARHSKQAAWFGLALAGVTLGRLDHGMIAATILGGMLVHALVVRRDQPIVARALPSVIAGAAFAAPMALYLLANHHWFHMWLPVSGRLKSSFPDINQHNLGRAWDVLVHPWHQGWYRSYRIYQMVLPVAVAPIAFVRFRRDAFDRFLAFAAPGVAALGLYNLFYVELWEQGHWYFPLSTLFVGLVVLRLLQRFDRPWLAPACAALCVLVFVKFQHRPPYHQRLADVYFVDAPALQQLYPTAPKLYEYDDGIVAFSTGFPTLVTKGYTLDPEAFDAYRAGHLTPLALQRGHTRFVSVSYLGLGALGPSSSSDEIRDFLRIPGVPRTARYHIDYRRGSFAVIDVEPQ